MIARFRAGLAYLRVRTAWGKPKPVRPWGGCEKSAGTAAGWNRALTVASRLTIVPAHDRPLRNLRHLPEDYSLAQNAGCGRLFSSSRPDRRPASRPRQGHTECPWVRWN